MAHALAGDPVVLDEIALDTPTEYPGYYSDASIVRGDSSYLFIWKHDVAGVNQVYGIRYAFDGTRLDQGAIPIAVPRAFTSLPRGSFDGTHWVVTWLDEREGGDTVFAARIAQDGTNLDPEGIQIDVGAGYIGFAPALASDGAGNSLIVWGRQPSTQAAILDVDGLVTTTFELDAEWSAESAVTFNGTNYLVANPAYQNSTSYALRGRRVATDGDILDDPALSLATLGAAPVVDAASDGTDFFVAYATSTTTAYRVVVADGSLGASGTLGEEGGLSVDYGNGAYLLAIARSTGVDLSRFDGAGSSLAQDTLTTGDYPSVLSVAAGSSDHFLVYQQDTAVTPTPALGTRLDTALNVLDDPPIVMNEVANQQFDPRAAFNGDIYLVVWADERDTGLKRDIYGVRVSAEGELIDSEAFLIASSAREQMYPDVASNGSDFLVVWEDWRDWPAVVVPIMTRVTAAGEVLDPSGVALDSDVISGREPRVASDGSDYFVIWREAAALNDPHDLWGKRVLSDGTMPDSEVVISDSSGVAAAALAYNGSEYLVAWEDAAQVFARATRILPLDGSVLDTPRIDLPGGGGAEYPDVGTDGSNWLVAWHVGTTGIQGVRVGPTGSVLDAGGIVIASDPGSDVYLYRPQVGFDGEQFLVSWARAEGPYWHIQRSLVAQRLSTAGVVAAGPELTISAQPVLSSGTWAELTEGVQGTLLATYARLPASTTIANERAQARLIVAPASDGSACELSISCASAYCVDGICCDSACDGPGDDCTTTPGLCSPGSGGSAGAPAGGGSGGADEGASSAGASDGGTPAAGGAPGNDGGAPAASGGDAGERGSNSSRGGATDAGVADEDDDGGCGCRAGAHGSPRYLGTLLLVGALLGVQRRRRRAV